MEAIRKTDLRMPFACSSRIACALKQLPIRQLAMVLGPGFVTSIGYIDPGNVAADLSGGSLVGVRLLWIIIACNLVAILVQALSARLGIYTGRSLPANCRIHYSKSTVFALWLLCELMAIATDVPSIVGAAIGFKLLFGTPLLLGSVLVTIYAFVLLRRQNKANKALEKHMLLFLLGIGAAVLIEFFLTSTQCGGSLSPPDPKLSAHLLQIGAAVLGATVMPHLIIVQSSLAAKQTKTLEHFQQGMLFRVSIIELLGALSIACVINCVIVGVFAGSPNCSVGSFAQAYCWLGKCGGAAAASIFAATLIAAGLSSAAVGTLSGQIVMDDLTDFKLSLPLRRALVALPTLLAIGCGCDSSMLIINSQVFLCFCLPFVLAPLIHLSFSKAVIPRSRLPLHWGILSSIVCIVVVAINTGMVINAATGMTKSWQPPSRLDGGHTVAMHP